MRAEELRAGIEKQGRKAGRGNDKFEIAERRPGPPYVSKLNPAPKSLAQDYGELNFSGSSRAGAGGGRSLANA
jgi:hypothetical protein